MSSYLHYAHEHHISQLKFFIQNLTPSNILTIRTDINKAINGNAFFPIHTWPLDLQLIHTNTPLSDRDTFKYVLFMFGNGCPPQLCLQHLCTSYFYAPDKAKKRLQQIKWLCGNLSQKAHVWFYFDIYCNRILHLNGTPHNLPTQI